MKKIIRKVQCFFLGHKMAEIHEPIVNDFGWEQHWHCFNQCGKHSHIQTLPDGNPLTNH